MLKDYLAKAVALVKSHLVTARLFVALSATEAAYSLAVAMVFNHNFGLYASLAAALMAVPRNAVAALAVKHFFFPADAQ